LRLKPEQLKQLVKPTLLFWGNNDPFGAPEVGKQMADIMPDADLHIIDGGHVPWLTQSKIIGPEVTTFLSRFK
jgi:pimeloyl-ACP methyl ester carboxylesterase